MSTESLLEITDVVHWLNPDNTVTLTQDRLVQFNQAVFLIGQSLDKGPPQAWVPLLSSQASLLKEHRNLKLLVPPVRVYSIQDIVNHLLGSSSTSSSTSKENKSKTENKSEDSSQESTEETMTVTPTEHDNLHKAMGQKVISIQDAIQAHKNKVKLLELPSLQFYMDALINIKQNVNLLQLQCYNIFVDVEGGKQNRAIALAEHRILADNFRDVSIAVNEVLAQLSATTAASTQRILRPKSSPPNFSGNVEHWVSFLDQFTNMVVDNPNVSNTDKLILLKQSLKGGTAFAIVDRAEVTDANWDIFWTALKSRYDNKRELAHGHLNQLLKLEPLTKQSSKGLLNLVDTVKSVSTALTRLGLELESNRACEFIISHLILKLLDYRTKFDFEKSLQNSTDFQELEVLLKFLTSTAAAIAATENVDLRAGQQGQQKISSKPKETQNPSPNGSGSPSNHSQKKKSKSKYKDKAPEGQKSKPSGQSTKDISNVTCGCCNSKGHYLSTCSKFLNLTPVQRGEMINGKRCPNCLSVRHLNVSECQSKRTCEKCDKRHHTLLHRDSRTANAAIASPSQPSKTVNQAAGQSSRGLLPTALVIIRNKDKSQVARALLDTGSQVTIISEHLVQLLNLPRVKSNLNSFTGPGASKLQPAKGLTSFELQSTNNQWKTEVEAVIFPKVTTDLPYQSFGINDWEHLRFLHLADPKFNESSSIDLLLGADIMDAIMGNHRIPGPTGKPSAYLTSLGWILYGALPKGNADSISINTIVDDESFDLSKFWMTEEISTQKSLTSEEKDCEKHFEETFHRLESGRYEVQIPFKKDHPPLGDSRQIAVKRWFAVERRLERNPELHLEYSKFMNEYLRLGHMSKLSYEEASITNYKPFYFPHHVVIKMSSSSTKYRIVFDGSAKTSTGISLNETMMVGPTVQPELIHQIMKFRLHRVALCADIEKMYRQVLVAPKHRDFQRILWRPSMKEPIREYRLNTVSYGTSSAPYLATRVINQLAKDEAKNFPIAAPVIANDFYVDDLISGEATIEKALELQRQLIACCDSAGFQLKKWSSNNSKLLDHLPQDFRETKTPLVFGETESIKTLGISWNPATDLFSFTGTSVQPHHPTKRNVLSIIAKIFDPLGWLAPCIVKAKIIMQMIWVLKLDWDDQIPRNLLEDEWKPFVNKLHHLQEIQVPRYLKYEVSSICELHAFSDASEKALSAAVYLRIQTNNKIACNLIMAKTKVAPIKTLSLPRLELTAAVMLVRLVSSVQSALKIKFNAIHYWTDSSIVLHWINASSSKWKTFIANRVAEIQEVSTIEQWHHVVSAENPSDCASRGLYPDELQHHSLWWNGPSWLLSDKLPIGRIPGSFNPSDLEEKRIQITPVLEKGNGLLNSLSKYSNWNTTRRVMGYILRFTRKARRLPTKSNQPSSLILTAAELYSAEKRIVRMIQAIAFEKEIKNLSQGKPVPKDSKLIALNPIYNQGIVRVGGRLKHSNLTPGQKNPLILPSNHHIVTTMILYLHKELCHTGTQGVLHRLRSRYWILNGRNTVKTALNKCLICSKAKAQPAQQLMGDLPKARVTKSRPFLHTGVDFAGPYMIKGTGGKRPTLYKGWISVFTCLSTRAIHLELVSGLSHEDFLLALKRFIARRGKPSELYSDNGTNFEGANNRMVDDIQIVSSFQSPEIAREIALEGINWNFNPPRAPNFGGLWERMIKSLKIHLHKMLYTRNYTFEEFSTMLTYVEAVLNSRPLLPLTDDPEDMEALTPAHFLIGSPLVMPPEPDLSHLQMNRLNRYQDIQKQLQNFWNRWSSEYLTTLQTRSKWQLPTKNVKVGELVLIIDDFLPPLQWKLARIKQLHPGTDGFVRVTTLETEGTYEEKDGKLKRRMKEFVRPISKIALLPAQENDEPKEEVSSNKQVCFKSISRPKATSIHSLFLHLLFIFCIFGFQPGTSKGSHNFVNLWDTFSHCTAITPPHYEIPFCQRGVRWLVIQDTGVVCSRQTLCEEEEHVMSDGLTCQSDYDSPRLCVSSIIADLDKIRCQNGTKTESNVEYLTRPEDLTHYCSVGGKTIKQCPHFTDQSDLVPVAIVHNIAYPVKHLNLKMVTKANQTEAYTCTNCTNGCTAICSGDKYYCAMFPCVDNTFRHPSPCQCEYNHQTETHYVETNHGLVHPQCWGSILTPVRKQDKSKKSPSYLCPECTISCTDYGITVISPNKAPTYVKAVKNPSHISMVTDKKVTEVYFTKNMLSGTGSISIEVWYIDHDSPTTFHKECPRIPVCKLIKCYICMENIGNTQCYSVWHWITLSTVGIVFSIFLMTIIWITRVLFYISWILFWPFRKCLQKVLERAKRKRNSPRPRRRRSDPEDPESIELVDKSSIYNTTTKETRGSSKTIFCSILIFGIISLCESCTNSASMTSASNECHYSSNGLVKCSIRVNTRLALSSIGQLSCFHIQDSRNNLLGSLTLETREVSVKCLKQSLYFVPRAVAHCQSVKHCYNPFGNAACYSNFCSEFSTNSSITEFEPSMKNLGWSYCQNYLGDWCFWSYNPHCHFYRAYLENPSNTAYEVYNCAEFRYHVTLQAEFMAGNVTTTSVITLTTGVAHEFSKIEFNLISLSTPPIPFLSKCIIRQNQRSAMIDCNALGSYSIGKIGELQCSSHEDAQELNTNCISSINLIRTIADHSGVKCISDIVDPVKIMEKFPLPLKLEDGILLPENDTIKFDASVSTLLEIQMETEDLKIVKEITATTCEASFIKITGCYSCLTGSVLTIEAKILESNNVVTFECPSVSFFIPLKLTTETTKKDIIIKFDEPHVDLTCKLKCSENTITLQVAGTLDYLSNTDLRAHGFSVSYQPPGSFSFHWTSFFGFSWFNSTIKILIYGGFFLVIIVTLVSSVKLILRKLL